MTTENVRIRKLHETVDEFCRFIKELPEVEKAWGPKEVLAHLVYWYESYVAQIEALLAEEPFEPPRGRWDDLNAQAVEASRGVSVEELLRRLRVASERLYGFAQTRDPESIMLEQTKGSTPNTLAWFITAEAGHMRHHLKRLERQARRDPIRETEKLSVAVNEFCRLIRELPEAVLVEQTWGGPKEILQVPKVNRHVFVICVQTIDITYIQLAYETVYLAVIMDVYTRAIRGWHLGRSLEQELTLTALRKALETHAPDIHHSDQGVQYAATLYTDLLQQHGAQISMAAIGKPEENGFAERLIRTIKEEEVALSEYRDYYDAYCRIGQFLEDVYTRKRIHSSLGYLTPAEFEACWVNQQLEVVDVH